jgi:hypothetical protein
MMMVEKVNLQQHFFDDGGKGEPPATFLSAVATICTARKYLTSFACRE